METDGNDSADQGPAGGKGWDGRASSGHEQAALPLLSPYEMANASPAAAVARLRASPSSAALFRDTFGAHALDDAALAWTGLLWALEVFQQSPADFYPYSSKYDAVLRGQATLDARERRGLALFDDPAKGNCAVCHPSAIRHGAFPQFTDRGHVALGVPRNNGVGRAPGARYDLGLCGPLRTDLADRRDYCGLFKTPTLRNVATRRVFFHNGVFHRLDDVLAFYAERDVHPARFYPRDRSGRVVKFDDLPPALAGNVNVDPPFGAAPGGRLALTARERADIAAFLATLTDGWRAPGVREAKAR